MPKINLTQGKQASFDDCDAGIVLAHRWWAVNLGSCFYAATKIGGRRVLMHRLILGLSVGDALLVDHINGNGLDNTRTNLRFADRSLNMRNRRRNANNKSGKSGLVFRSDRGAAGAWVATGMIDGRLVTKSFGCLRRGNEAAKALAEKWRDEHEARYGITVREETFA